MISGWRSSQLPRFPEPVANNLTYPLPTILNLFVRPPSHEYRNFNRYRRRYHARKCTSCALYQVTLPTGYLRLPTAIGLDFHSPATCVLRAIGKVATSPHRPFPLFCPCPPPRFLLSFSYVTQILSSTRFRRKLAVLRFRPLPPRLLEKLE